jgi:hypothetical protein
MRGRTLDVSFLVTAGTGYSSAGISAMNSETLYSTNNEFNGSFLIQRDIKYYLRMTFDDFGGFTRSLSEVDFGLSDLRTYSGTVTPDIVATRPIKLHLANSHNAATTLRVDYVRLY